MSKHNRLFLGASRRVGHAKREDAAAIDGASIFLAESGCRRVVRVRRLLATVGNGQFVWLDS